MNNLPACLIEKIATYNLCPRSKQCTNLLLVNRYLSSILNTCCALWSDYLHLFVQQEHHDLFKSHEQYPIAFRNLLQKKILPLTSKSYSLKEFEFPNCKTCQFAFLDILTQESHMNVFFKNVTKIYYILFDVIISTLGKDYICNLMINFPHLHMYVTGNRFDDVIEELCVRLWEYFPYRIHFTSLLLNALKNKWIVMSTIESSILWTTVGQGERIQLFDSAFYPKLNKQFEDYLEVLYILLSSPSKKHIYFMFDIPLEFYFYAFTYLISNERIWNNHTKHITSLFPLKNICERLYMDNRWQTRLLFTLFKGNSQHAILDNKTPHYLKACLDAFTKVITKEKPGVKSFFHFFEKHFENRFICQTCADHLLLSTDDTKYSQMCLLCILQKHLTFTNWTKLSYLLESYGFPLPKLRLALSTLCRSELFRSKLRGLLFVCLKENNITGINQIVATCKQFEISPQDLFQVPHGNSFLSFRSHLSSMMECSGGCLATFFQKCHLPTYLIEQCLAEMTEYQTNKGVQDSLPSPFFYSTRKFTSTQLDTKLIFEKRNIYVL